MADITTCLDKECPKRETCYRYKARADKYRQSYFLESPRKGDDCDLYWPVDSGGCRDFLEDKESRR